MIKIEEGMTIEELIKSTGQLRETFWVHAQCYYCEYWNDNLWCLAKRLHPEHCPLFIFSEKNFEKRYNEIINKEPVI